MKQNLFVITGIGQLRNIYGFIDEYQLEENSLMVLYTERNMAVIQNIKNNIRKNVFKDIYFLKQPDMPMKWNRAKGKAIYQSYKEQIERIQQEHGLQRIFLCNRDNYYYFFKNLSQRYNLELNLLEEGLTTYRLFYEEWKAKNVTPTKTEIGVEKALLKENFRLFTNSLFKVVLLQVSRLAHRDIVRAGRQIRAKISRYQYGIINKFNNYYVCFPEAVKKYRTKENNIYPVAFAYNKSDEVFVEDATKPNVLFVNQKYGIQYEDHFKIIFSVLSNLGYGTIYIKLHPREDKAKVYKIIEKYKYIFTKTKFVIVENADNIPVEDLLISNNIGKLIALTSSSLFYAKRVKKDIETYSIAKEYRKCCDEMGISEEKQKTFLIDYENIDNIFAIEQIKGGDCLLPQSEASEKRTLFVSEEIGILDYDKFSICFSMIKDIIKGKLYVAFSAKDDLYDFYFHIDEYKRIIPNIEIIPLYSTSYTKPEEILNNNDFDICIGACGEWMYNSRVEKETHMISIAEKLVQETDGLVELYEDFSGRFIEIKKHDVEQLI